MRTRASVLVLAVASSSVAAQERSITLRAGTLLDGKGGARSNVGVVVRGTKIAAVGGPAEGVTYDLSRLTVMPGGIDTHVHIGSHFDLDGRAHDEADGREPLEQAMLFAVENAYATLVSGITTVQSLGAASDRDLRDWIARGTVPGPRMVTSYTVPTCTWSSRTTSTTNSSSSARATTRKRVSR